MKNKSSLCGVLLTLLVVITHANKASLGANVDYYSQSLSSLTPNGNYPNGVVRYYTDGVLLKTTAAGDQYFQLHFTLPTAVKGRATFLKGVQLCYMATFGNASLISVSLQLYATISGSGPTLVSSVSDDTTRTDNACRIYNLAAPSKLAGNNHVTLVLRVNFANTSGQVLISSVTAILKQSQKAGALVQQDFSGDIPMADPATTSGAGQ